MRGALAIPVWATAPAAVERSHPAGRAPENLGHCDDPYFRVGVYSGALQSDLSSIDVHYLRDIASLGRTRTTKREFPKSGFWPGANDSGQAHSALLILIPL